MCKCAECDLLLHDKGMYMCIENDVYVSGDMRQYIELDVYGHVGAVYKYIPISIDNTQTHAPPVRIHFSGYTNQDSSTHIHILSVKSSCIFI